MKLVLLKLESDDTPGKIASFYRTALAKYGKVLDCTGNKSSDSQKQDSKSKELTCEDDHSDDGVVLKAGTKDNQHIVSIKTKASSRIIQLVYLVSRNEDKKI